MDGVARTRILKILRIPFGKWTGGMRTPWISQTREVATFAMLQSRCASLNQTMTLTINDSNSEPARWRATERVLLQAEWNHECGSSEPLNFDCADHDPFYNSDEGFGGTDDSSSSVGRPGA